MLMKCLRCQTILFDIHVQFARSVYNLRPTYFDFIDLLHAGFRVIRTRCLLHFESSKTKCGPNFQLSQLTEPLGDVLT